MPDTVSVQVGDNVVSAIDRESLSDLRIALVHEWLVQRAGSEVTFEQMAIAFAQADLFALSYDRDVRFDFGDRAVRTTAIDRLCRTARGRSLLLPIMPLAFKSLQDANYDVVVSSTHAFSRAFAPADAIKLSYTYTPLRYVWHPDIDDRGRSLIARIGAPLVRRQDLRCAALVDSFAAISSAVASRVEAVYGRPARIIYPPCDVEYYSSASEETLPHGVRAREYVLTAGRQIEYKRHDLAIRVGHALRLPVVVAGSGPERTRLAQLRDELGSHVLFVDSPSRALLRTLYANAAFTCFGAFEDFGIVPVESLAAGTPVLGYRRGGTLDTVSEEVGVLVEAQTPAAFASGAAELLRRSIGREPCRQWAAQFSADRFRREMRAWVGDVVAHHRSADGLPKGSGR